MYLVLTTPNCADSTVAVVAPRMITEDPRRAIAAAREAYSDGDFISSVIIYKMTRELDYYLVNVIDQGKGSIVVFVAQFNGKKWIETFYSDEAAFVAAAG